MELMNDDIERLAQRRIVDAFLAGREAEGAAGVPGVLDALYAAIPAKKRVLMGATQRLRNWRSTFLMFLMLSGFRRWRLEGGSRRKAVIIGRSGLGWGSLRFMGWRTMPASCPTLKPQPKWIIGSRASTPRACSERWSRLIGMLSGPTCCDGSSRRIPTCGDLSARLCGRWWRTSGCMMISSIRSPSCAICSGRRSLTRAPRWGTTSAISPGGNRS